MTQETTETRKYLPPIHTSPETAYIIEDYPYGFVLRCKMRIWIESNKRGQRILQQTTDPRKSFEYWNKPKASTYSDIHVLYLDGEGHVQRDAASAHQSIEDLAAFEVRAKDALGDVERKTLTTIQKVAAIYRAHFTKNEPSKIEATPPIRIV